MSDFKKIRNAKFKKKTLLIFIISYSQIHKDRSGKRRQTKITHYLLKVENRNQDIQKKTRKENDLVLWDLAVISIKE